MGNPAFARPFFNRNLSHMEFGKPYVNFFSGGKGIFRALLFSRRTIKWFFPANKAEGCIFRKIKFYDHIAVLVQHNQVFPHHGAADGITGERKIQFSRFLYHDHLLSFSR
ncbi:MAG: hypothetical protein LBB66_08385 [Desulfovibrio sp.]|nr:hypothetical protein [Desulfovibrio sp.]